MRSMCASGCGGSDDLIMTVSPGILPANSSFTSVLHQSSARVRGMSRTATPAERVRLVVTLSEAGSSLCCIAVSLETRSWCAVGSAAYSFWARNCMREYC
jgi:hypothetical protein